MRSSPTARRTGRRALHVRQRRALHSGWGSTEGEEGGAGKNADAVATVTKHATRATHPHSTGAPRAVWVCTRVPSPRGAASPFPTTRLQFARLNPRGLRNLCAWRARAGAAERDVPAAATAKAACLRLLRSRGHRGSGARRNWVLVYTLPGGPSTARCRGGLAGGGLARAR